MSERSKITDRRLLAALDYIDQKYIDDVFGLIKEPPKTEDAPTARRSPFKHAKIYIVLAASVLLLSMASPIINYVVETVRTFSAAGWGSATTVEEENESKEIYELYPDYTPAPLSEERIAEIEKVWVNINSCWKENGGDLIYLGDFDGCVCFVSYGQLCIVETETVAGYEFEDNCFTLHAIYNGEKMLLSEAYERGYITQEEVGMMAAYHARIQYGIVEIVPPETTTPLYRLFPDYVPAPLDEEKKKEIEVLLGGNTNWYHETVSDLYSIIYLGTFNNCIVLSRFSSYDYLKDRIIAGYNFCVSGDTEIVVYVNSQIIDLEDAYDQGLLTEEEIGFAACMHDKWVNGLYTTQK